MNERAIWKREPVEDEVPRKRIRKPTINKTRLIRRKSKRKMPVVMMDTKTKNKHDPTRIKNNPTRGPNSERMYILYTT